VEALNSVELKGKTGKFNIYSVKNRRLVI
jgi:hypothetical protein